MFTVEFGKHKYVLPSKLDECNYWQFADLCRVILAYQNRKFDFHQFKMLFTVSILQLKGKDKLRKKNKYFWQNLILLSDYIFSEENQFVKHAENNAEIIQNFNNYPIQHIRVNGIKYIGSEFYFKNISFGQYIDALHHVSEFEKFKEMKSLQNLASILFLPKKYRLFGKTIKYIEFNSKDSEKFKYVDPGVFYGIFLQFTSFQIQLASTIIYIHGNEIDFSILFKDDSDFKSKIPSLGMKALEFSIAETGVFGNRDDLRAANLWEVLIHLYNSKKNYLDDKAMIEKK